MDHASNATSEESLSLRPVALLHPVSQRDVPHRTCILPSPTSAAPAEVREDGDGDGDDREDEGVAQLCVAMVDTTTYSSAETQENVAWVTLHTDPLAPVAVLEVDAGCWRRHRSASRCRPCALVPENLRGLPLWSISPLRDTFWKSLDADVFPYGNTSSSLVDVAVPPEPWLRRINMAARHGRSAPARSLAQVHIPDLRSLELTGNLWQTETLPALPAMPRLRELNLHDNAISAMPKDFFSYTPRLEHVNLARNSLKSLPKSIATLKMLRLLDVTNPITKQPFDIEYISELPNLQILGLENQEIIGDIMPIISMPSLVFLNLSGCGLTSLGSDVLNSDTTELQVLDLSNNKLRSVTNTVLMKFPKLSRLLLNNNELRVLGNTNLLNAPKLVYLDVSNNHLRRFPNFPHESIIKELKARDNVLEFFSDKFWECCPQLEKLDLSQNHLQYSPKLNFQEKLLTLDLSNNEIKILVGVDLGTLKLLKFIDLSNNLLSTIDPKLFTDYEEVKFANFSFNKLWQVSLTSESLVTLDLSNNALRSVPELHTSSLCHLNLSHNLIPIANFSSINSLILKKMDVSYNKISVAYLANKSIENVDFSHNKLKYPPYDDSRVTSLNLIDNPLNGENEEDDKPKQVWDTWYIWVLGLIASLAILSFLFLIGAGLWVRKMSNGNEPLITSTFRNPSPVSLNAIHSGPERFRR